VSRTLRRRYGRAGMRSIRLAHGHRLGVAPVLAGAYRGKDVSNRTLLEHAVPIDAEGGLAGGSLCKRIPEERLSDWIDRDLSHVTCPECQRRLPAVVLS
jgi:hypothetical protein